LNIAVTGGTGFIGRYIIRELTEQGHQLKAWKRDTSNRAGLDALPIQWSLGSLEDLSSMETLVDDCEAVVHSAVWKPGKRFQGDEGPLDEYMRINVMGTLNLILAAQRAGVKRFIFLSSCAVYHRILDDRPLDEAHPSWPGSHYGAAKAAIEKFTHSLAVSDGFNICSLRPCGVYGVASPVESSKYFDLIKKITRGESVKVSGGGKEVHAADVAKAVSLLLSADGTAGETFNCCDRYHSEYEVATMAREIAGSNSEILGQTKTPQHQINTQKIESLGLKFGGRKQLEQTITRLIEAVQTA